MHAPRMLTTACRHGYIVTYAVVDGQLLLREMKVGAVAGGFKKLGAGKARRAP